MIQLISKAQQEMIFRDSCKPLMHYTAQIRLSKGCNIKQSVRETIIIIMKHTLKLTFKVKQSLAKKAAIFPSCLVWIILLLLITKSSLQTGICCFFTDINGQPESLVMCSANSSHFTRILTFLLSVVH